MGGELDQKTYVDRVVVQPNFVLDGGGGEEGVRLSKGIADPGLRWNRRTMMAS